MDIIITSLNKLKYKQKKNNLGSNAAMSARNRLHLGLRPLALLPRGALHLKPAPQNRSSQHEHAGASELLFSHCQAAFERGAPLVGITSKKHFVMRIDPGLNLTVQNEPHQFVFQRRNCSSEGLGHSS